MPSAAPIRAKESSPIMRAPYLAHADVIFVVIFVGEGEA